MEHTMMQWNSWKYVNSNLLIIAKTDFCSLIFQVLVSYVGLKIYLLWTTSISIHPEFSWENFRHLHTGLKNLQITFRR